MAEAEGDTELGEWLGPRPQLNLVRGQPPSDVHPNSLDAAIYDLEERWFSGLQSVFEADGVLGEAFYSIACDYSMARYLTWPWYRGSSELDEPFLAYFQLWRHGARLRYPDRGQAVLFLESA